MGSEHYDALRDRHSQEGTKKHWRIYLVSAIPVLFLSVLSISLGTGPLGPHVPLLSLTRRAM